MCGGLCGSAAAGSWRVLFALPRGGGFGAGGGALHARPAEGQGVRDDGRAAQGPVFAAATRAGVAGGRVPKQGVRAFLLFREEQALHGGAQRARCVRAGEGGAACAASHPLLRVRGAPARKRCVPVLLVAGCDRLPRRAEASCL